MYFSGKASESTRTLALGGLAIIWLFKIDTGNGPTLDASFLPPLLFLTTALALDLFHYVVGAFIWHRFYIHHETNTSPKKQDNIKAPEWKRDLISSFFYAKISSMVIAYIWLFSLVLHKLFNSH